jgi:hypothetical protein
MAVVHFMVRVMNNRSPLSNIENTVAHFILQHFTFAKTVIRDIRINVVIALGESCQDDEQESA